MADPGMSSSPERSSVPCRRSKCWRKVGEPNCNLDRDSLQPIEIGSAPMKKISDQQNKNGNTWPSSPEREPSSKASSPWERESPLYRLLSEMLPLLVESFS